MYQTKKQKGVITDKTILIKKNNKNTFQYNRGSHREKNKRGRNDPSKPEYVCRHVTHA
jgi:hypothetical protein